MDTHNLKRVNYEEIEELKKQFLNVLIVMNKYATALKRLSDDVVKMRKEFQDTMKEVNELNPQLKQIIEMFEYKKKERQVTYIG